ncbi:hypothetical protein RRG08_050657 [Elysia crispata]|uniref:Receptor ligand binding region domain-containing protein n=1 Tax=Elysia crispata TaxID=231223 RepID=A0AAE1AE07_9GAST|nr:hypothetical protein RRG08_050657 [Elysia crispata]
MGSLEDRTALTAKLKMLALTLAIVTCSSISFAETAVAADTCSAFIYPGTDDVDVKIAAIFGMHASNESSCSDQPQVNAIQIGLAMQWAVSLLNGENSTGSFLPGVKIGVDIYDDCNQDFLAARHAGSIAGQFSHRQAVQCSLSQQSNQQMVIPIAGIIGTTRSQTTTMVTRVARSTNLPVVGLAATLAELSDKSKYPGFVRTTPSDHVQAQAMLELALEFQWSYIVGIFTNDNYGQMGMERLQTLATEHRICVSTVTSLDILGQLDEKALESFVRDTLFSKVKLSNGTLGVVYFGQDEGLIRLLKLAETWSLKWLEGISNLKKIHWMVSDAVDLNTDLIDLVRQYKTRVVGVDMVTAHLPSFQAFEQEVLWSPPAWAREGRWRGALQTLARERYGCASYNTSKAPASAAGCSVSGSNIYSGYLAAAVDSVYLLANTLKTMHSELCHGQSGVCDSFMASLEDGLLTSRNLTEFDYTDLSSPHVPPEFAATGRALVPNGGDFLVRNQSCYDIQANMGDTFVTVGSYSLDGVDLLPQSDPIMPQSGCSNVCQECHDLGSKSYEFLDGDYILLGIFSVHWKAGDMAFKCGAFRKDSDSFPAMKAFVHAVGRLIQETGVKFGYLALDDCYSPLLITRMLSKILSGDLEVTCKSTRKSPRRTQEDRCY